MFFVHSLSFTCTSKRYTRVPCFLLTKCTSIPTAGLNEPKPPQKAENLNINFEIGTWLVQTKEIFLLIFWNFDIFLSSEQDPERKSFDEASNSNFSDTLEHFTQSHVPISCSIKRMNSIVLQSTPILYQLSPPPKKCIPFPARKARNQRANKNKNSRQTKLEPYWKKMDPSGSNS